MEAKETRKISQTPKPKIETKLFLKYILLQITYIKMPLIGDSVTVYNNTVSDQFDTAEYSQVFFNLKHLCENYSQLSRYQYLYYLYI